MKFMNGKYISSLIDNPGLNYQILQKEIILFAPLYVTNLSVNNCLYY